MSNVEEWQGTHEKLLFRSCKKHQRSQQSQYIVFISGNDVDWNRVVALSNNRHKFGWTQWSNYGGFRPLLKHPHATGVMTTAARTNDFVGLRCLCSGVCLGECRGLVVGALLALVANRHDTGGISCSVVFCSWTPPPPSHHHQSHQKKRAASCKN